MLMFAHTTGVAGRIVKRPFVSALAVRAGDDTQLFRKPGRVKASGGRTASRPPYPSFASPVAITGHLYVVLPTISGSLVSVRQVRCITRGRTYAGAARRDSPSYRSVAIPGRQQPLHQPCVQVQPAGFRSRTPLSQKTLSQVRGGLVFAAFECFECIAHTNSPPAAVNSVVRLNVNARLGFKQRCFSQRGRRTAVRL